MPGFALIFPGQGSQYVGMGQDLYHSSPAARAVFDEADRAWQGQLTPLIFAGPTEALTDTVNAQPVLFTVSMACWAALREALAGVDGARPSFVAGHSLGEYAALAAAGVFSFGTGLWLVGERGRAMKAAGEARPGGMAAVLGLDMEAVAQVCRGASAQTHEPVVVANDNAPGQIVISGTSEGVRAAAELARAAGAKRVVRLAVSIAAHSPLMMPAAALFAPALNQADLHPPGIPVVANRNARVLSFVGEVVQELDGQLTSPVLWTASVQHMVAQGVSTFVEVGPKDVLTGLLKRIVPTATGIACGSVSGVEQATDHLRQQASPS